MGNDVLSRAAEEYLGAIYELQEARGRATTSAVARRLGVSAPSVTRMIRKLASLRLLEHTPYHGARLTPAGRTVATRAARRRDLIRRYLTERLGCSWGHARVEADRLERVISEELEERLAASLGDGSLGEVNSSSLGGSGAIGPRRGGIAEGRGGS